MQFAGLLRYFSPNIIVQNMQQNEILLGLILLKATTLFFQNTLAANVFLSHKCENGTFVSFTRRLGSLDN